MASLHATPLVCMLTHLMDYLIEFFLLPEIEDATIWESDRNEYLKSIEKKVSSLMQSYIVSSLIISRMLQISLNLQLS